MPRKIAFIGGTGFCKIHSSFFFSPVLTANPPKPPTINKIFASIFEVIFWSNFFLFEDRKIKLIIIILNNNNNRDDNNNDYFSNNFSEKPVEDNGWILSATWRQKFLTHRSAIYSFVITSRMHEINYKMKYLSTSFT